MSIHETFHLVVDVATCAILVYALVLVWRRTRK